MKKEKGILSIIIVIIIALFWLNCSQEQSGIEATTTTTLEVYNITYNLDGGTNNGSNPATYTVTTPTITLLAPTKSGYTFGGWYLEDAYVTTKTEIALGSTGNVTLYAKWTATGYAITYNLDGGTNDAGNPATYTVATPTITLLAPTKAGYTFGGWYLEDTYVTAKTEIALGSMGAVTVYAKWTTDTYNITYNLDGGTNDAGNPATYTVATPTITLLAPTKAGYTFGGWYLEDTYVTAKTEIALGSMGAVTVYAKWTTDTYNITYNLDGGTNNGSNPATYTVTTP
ncbi:MAG: InlB B-repeat-containing protein, partial [Spirochaetes bacterium]|nr:InlB B-repeat-containing protein [Spirochaetota bacterium]